MQKKASKAQMEKELSKAREEALHQEKLQEEERKINEAFEKSKQVLHALFTEKCGFFKAKHLQWLIYSKCGECTVT